MSKVMAYGLFPVHFSAALAFAFFAIAQGWSAPVCLMAVAGLTALVVAVAERIHPEYPEWNRARRDVRTDVLHTLISMIALPPLVELGVVSLVLWCAGRLADGSYTGVWPHHLPLSGQLALALLVSQFFEYWFHRWAHETPWLWRLHATHHSPKRLYWLNASRFHPLDTALSIFLGMGVLLSLGASPPVLFLLTVWIAVHGMYQHCNIRLRLGPLNYIFSMAELHRWHHAVDPAEANHNYGNNIILWDLVFGTFYWPRDRRPPQTIGLQGFESFPENYSGQLLSPFRWRQLQIDNHKRMHRAKDGTAPS